MKRTMTQLHRCTFVWLVAVLFWLCLSPATVRAADSPWADACAVWHLGESQPGEAVAVRGNARVGVALTGAERDASLRRGGDGLVAELDGGYLAVGESTGPVTLSGDKEMSLCMRVRDASGSWDKPLLAEARPSEDLSVILAGTPVDRAQIGFRETQRVWEGNGLEFLLRTQTSGRARSEWNLNGDFDRGLLRVGVPAELIGPRDWHDVIVRLTGPRLELFVDGVLVDEEWPHGAIRGLTGPYLIGAGWEQGQLRSGFRGQVDHVALWRRALRDEEVVALSGGQKETIARRELEILGPATADGQYWRPRGHNAFVGDVMLFFHDGRLHVFYLFDRRHHGSKWGTGAHQFAHRSTSDLVHWVDHPMALAITDPTECSLGTGCCVFRDSTYYLYYIQHGRRLALSDAPYPGDNIFVATSQDGDHFTKRPEPVVLVNYHNGGDINPHVFATEKGDRYLMTISGWKVFESPDLLKWAEVSQPQLESIKWICTANFNWNDWRYFTGCGQYAMSRQPIEETREWVRPPSQALRDALGVPVVCEFTGNRRIYAGFAAGSYAQELVFRELTQEPDGSLGMKWPAEMIPATRATLPVEVQPLVGDATVGPRQVRLAAPEGFACTLIAGLPQNVRITVRAKPSANVLNYGLCCRGNGEYETGCELRLEPAAQRIQYARPVQHASDPTARNGASIDQVAGLDGETTIDMIVKDDLVDVCVGGRRTLLQRQAGQGDRLFFFVRNGTVSFEDIEVRPLLDQPAPGTVFVPGDLLFANSDFESGELTNWKALGDAFDHAQPTRGDNTSARGASSSQHQGAFWVGTYERFTGAGGKPGDARGDAATGTLESTPFVIEQPLVSFLISGGRKPDEEYVSLWVDGQEVKRATGHQTETMRRVVWDATTWVGKTAKIVIADRSQAPWGVINVDDFRYALP